MTPIPGRKLRLTLAGMSASGATVRIVAAYHDQPCKKCARLRFNPQSALLWAGNPDDWAIATRKPHPPLVRPEKDCVELIAYENPAIGTTRGYSSSKPVAGPAIIGPREDSGAARNKPSA